MTTLTQRTKQYILDCIDNSGYSDVELETDDEKKQFISDTFYSEYGWCAERHGVRYAAQEWLRGLPSSMNVVFYNHDILELYLEWGILSEHATEDEEDATIEHYWKIMGLYLSKAIEEGRQYAQANKCHGV